MSIVLLPITLLVGAVVTVMVLTGVGARRRGNGWPTSVLSAIGFPVTWTVWYLRDETPYTRHATD